MTATTRTLACIAVLATASLAAAIGYTATHSAAHPPPAAPAATQSAAAASPRHAYGMTTGTDYGPHETMADAAAVESLRRSMGGINAMEPIKIR